MKLNKILQVISDPLYICEKLAGLRSRSKRLARLRGTPAEKLSIGHIDSLELLDMANDLGIKTVYDIGANVGTWTLLAKSIISDASVEAFEPLDMHEQDFKKNTSGVSGVRLHKIALGPKNTIAKLHVTKSSDSTSMLNVSEDGRLRLGLEEAEDVTTNVRCLDDYQKEKNLPLPDLIKLDVQGYELEVLKGATKSLQSAKAVIAEVCFVEYYKNQCLFHDLVCYMAKFGFQVSVMAVCTPLGSTINITDVLFIKRNTRE